MITALKSLWRIELYIVRLISITSVALAVSMPRGTMKVFSSNSEGLVV